MCKFQEGDGRKSIVTVGNVRCRTPWIRAFLSSKHKQILLFACFTHYVAALCFAAGTAKQAPNEMWIQCKTSCFYQNVTFCVCVHAHTCHTSHTPPQTCSHEALITNPWQREADDIRVIHHRQRRYNFLVPELKLNNHQCYKILFKVDSLTEVSLPLHPYEPERHPGFNSSGKAFHEV